MAAKKRASEAAIATALRELREEQDKTQSEVAKEAGVVQGEISVLEKRTNLDGVRIGTLRRYVEALGFELELAAVVGDARVPLGPAKD